MAAEQHGQPENIPSSDQASQTIMAAVDHDVNFRHQPLPGNGYIRLIEVLDINKEGVRCQLTCWRIDSAPQYDAISYTWGDPNLRTSITINDRRLEVTQNCEYVLRQARWHGGSRYHWVDAICIDQNNIPEKNGQVSRMGAIYKDAQRVLACVGDHDDASRTVLATLRRYAGFLHLLTTLGFEKTVARRWLRTLTKHLMSTHWRLAKALLAFAQRPYFRRLWVLQELFHGRAIDICCGTNHESFEDLLRFNSLTKSYGHPLRISRIIERTARCLWLGGQRRTPSPYEACKQIEKLPPQLTTGFFFDPRDRVYGILSMVKWGKRNPIQPDYSKGLLSLYFEVIQAIGEELCWTSLYYPIADRTLCNLGLMGSSLQELVDYGVVSADVIEVRQSSWFEVANTNIGNPSSHERENGGQNELCFYFGDCGWQLGEPWHSTSPEAVVLNLPELGKWGVLHDRTKIILTQQGQACLVWTMRLLELGSSILKLNGPEFSCDVGPVVMGFVMEKQPDGRPQIVGNVMIRELGDYVLKYEVERSKGMIVTKGVCRDGSDQPGILELNTVWDHPWYGMKKTWEDFTKDSQEPGSGDEVN